MELLTPAEVAKLLKITKRTLFKPAFRDIISPIRLGPSMLRYDAADVQQAINRLKAKE